MKHHTTILTSRQHELEARLDPAWQPETEAPVVGTGNLVYEMGEKVRAIAAGGIGLVEQLVEAIGLRARLDERVQVFTRHRPYHESDHILTMAYNVLTGGQALEDIDRLRNDVTFLDAVGARRLPDPTTAGDFLRRFTPADVTALMEAQNDARLCVWKGQPSRFRAQAVIDVDGTIVPTIIKVPSGASKSEIPDEQCRKGANACNRSSKFVTGALIYWYASCERQSNCHYSIWGSACV